MTLFFFIVPKIRLYSKFFYKKLEYNPILFFSFPSVLGGNIYKSYGNKLNP